MLTRFATKFARFLQTLPLPMVRNSDGKSDAMLTAAAMGLAVVLVRFLLSGLTLTIADRTMSFGPFDAMGAGVILGATFTSYVTRRNKDKSLAALATDGLPEDVR